MRIAIIDRSKCTKERCGWQCIKICPVNRMRKECVVKDEEGWPIISESLCTGCGLCVKRCPVNAIKVINLVEERGRMIHQYGVNSFRLFNLPLPKRGSVVGLVGANGIGKTTSLNILSGKLKPNLGMYDKGASWDDIMVRFRGHEIQNYFLKLKEGSVRVSLKPQNVDLIAEVFKGSVLEVLKEVSGKENVEEIAGKFQLNEILGREVGHLSGGELQRVAICAAYLKDADVHYFDEPTSYLDIKQRLRITERIRELAAKGSSVMVVEHDLAVLDYLSDYIHVLYGVKGAYGIVSKLKGVRNGINEFLDGYLKGENIRFRKEGIRFEIITEETEQKAAEVFSYPAMKKGYEGFELECEGGEVRMGEIIGIVGENAIGKTTFVKLLAGVERPDEGEVPHTFRISYKPQYVRVNSKGRVGELFERESMNRELFEREIKVRMEIEEIWDKQLEELSGGELQRVAIALSLSREADVYLLDEPSAFLDVEQRLKFADVLKRVIIGEKKVGFVVDHDIILIDAVSSRMVVFEGTASVKGRALRPMSKKGGMNLFLSKMGITLRRDKDTKRPRVNKPGSRMDREQREAGEYYYYERAR